MSNAEASKLYEAVIEEVISDSRQDFENSGIDESTLQDLKKIWCEKLSQTGVAKFSWDDEEAEPVSVPGPGPILVPGSELNNNESIVSQAVQDAQNAINQDYNNGSGQINIKQESLGSNGIELPDVREDNETQVKLESTTDYDENNGLILPKVNQADGDFEFTVYTDNGDEFMERLKRKQQIIERKQKKTVGQVDGVDDEDDDDDDDIFNDSDDINSDLDDDLESEKSDEEQGEQEGQIMLCLYDKVQRVKNKWKSNLKEGIANIDGKDYVFQKATGESEW
ncbi:transcription factor IIA, alpha/beta subunit [Hyphopichia burtonii NRRL Y-1933]|uniref:Transcription initiation factor IIA large subunit n=1 Tax=Hyphopichia burtonii NRRL Y-1933 TaxID=984485 RepID=A0A1E4RPN6_9ASCO|nr:transcription factor IIA, alpha/beta subunit [Hyphopichia burtonii NRRL Y-1933]ODV69186.1 transcription factor IIA, alpha/beta subunit [Hyphopichia burtonii NRRL Y-1933]